jgi:CRISPR-associated protein Csb2
MTYFCITVRWLDDRYHGLLDRNGPPEWPPSPYRLFQALVAGVARRGEIDGEIGKSLEWLEGRAPIIIAPRSFPGPAITRFVPNNDGDKKPDRQNRLTGKTSRPTIMLDRPEVHYLWPGAEDCLPARPLIEGSRFLSCFGWGIDLAYSDGQMLDEEQIGKLDGIRWFPTADAFHDTGLLRIPKAGSMADLRRAHESALTRIEHGRPLRTVHKPEVFDRVFYTSIERPLGRPSVTFSLRTGDDDSYRYPHAKLMHIAGMTRRAAIQAMKEYPPEELEDADAWVGSFVAGHCPAGIDNHERFSYVPLPSIGHEHADAMIRRVMIIAPFAYESHLRHLANQLDGLQLEPEDGTDGPVLDRLRSDPVTLRYLKSSRVWASVTPVILPGHDDHKPAKTIKLVERALRQSGMGQSCSFTWSAKPNFAHCLTAHKYDHEKQHVGYYRPQHLEGLTAVHVRITFEHSVAGPLCIGAGRHCGFGILASVT